MRKYKTALKWIALGKNDLILSIDLLVKSAKGQMSKESTAAYDLAKAQLLELEEAEQVLIELSSEGSSLTEILNLRA